MGSLYSEINRRHFTLQVSQEDATERLAALEALLARRDDQLLVSKALDLLPDTDPEVRRRAAEAIGSVGTKEAAEAVVESWERFSDDGLEAAISALAAIGRPAIVVARKKLTHSNAAVRAAAASALGHIDARTVDADLATALADPDARVVCAAARALGRHGAGHCLADLGVVFRRNPECRASVVEALGEIGTPAARRMLEKALEDGDPDVRDRARNLLQRQDAA